VKLAKAGKTHGGAKKMA
nr:FKBP25, nucleolin=25 kda FK506-binding protein {N-terminal} [mice, T-cell line CTLL-20, Peptide Partial, 17 aa] [Mus sp.]